MSTIELGLDTFGDVTLAPSGHPLPHAAVLRNVLAEAELADRLGIDFFGVGEHHRADFAISAPEVVLAAIATRTTRIRLGTAVTVLSTDDPVRVYERFATLDALSNGRAEVILGRGSFTESFPLFGYSLEDYDDLFEEKLALFAAIRDAGRTGQPVHWKGTVRPPVEGMRVYPPVERPPLSTWVGVGGSPESVVRAARYGFPLTLAIIGGDPQRFRLISSSTTAPSPSSAADDAAGRRALARPHRRHRRRRRARSSGRTTRSCGTGSAPSAAGPRPAGPSSIARSPRGRCTSARPRRWRGRSRPRCRNSARRASISSTARARCRTRRMMRSIELYGREVIPRVRRLLAEAVSTPEEQRTAAPAR